MKLFRLISLLVFAIFFEQFWAQNYSSNFTTESQILRYFEENLTKLSPIEGKYDGQISMRTSSPFVKDIDGPATTYIVKNPYSQYYELYVGDGKIVKDQNFKIEAIGETNAYRIYWGNSSNRTYLENGLRLKVNINLSRTDARKFANNPNYIDAIVLGFDFVKIYPTSSMYANAARKALEEETKPTIWTGTGFALKEGYIVTNYHVVENAKTISVKGVNGSFTDNYYAKTIATDKINDIALLKLEGITLVNIPYSVKTLTSDVGEDVWVLGYPLTSTMGDEIKLTTGVISAKSGFEGDVSRYQISAPVQPGNSGGPVFDSKGNLIGIVCSHHRGAENVNYAIKASYLRNLIESSINTDILPKANKLSTLNLADKVKAVKNFVYYIECKSRFDSSISNNYSIQSSNTAHPSFNNTGYYPSIKTSSGSLSVTAVEVNSNETIMSFSCTNNLPGGWMNISRDAYIMTNGIKYKLIDVDNIAYEPKYTYFEKVGQTRNFRLHFQAIPQNAKIVDFIESQTSPWKIYGIKIK